MFHIISSKYQHLWNSGVPSGLISSSSSISFEYKVFIYVLLVWTPLISIYVIFKGVQKPDLLKRIEEKRKKLKINPDSYKEFEMT